MQRYFLIIILTVFSLACSNQYIEFASLHSEPLVLASEPADDYLEETFRLKGSEKDSLVDILILIDSSGSMKNHLNHLGKSLSGLLSVIENYDWQIAFTTVDHGDHKNTDTVEEALWQNHTDSKMSFGTLINLDDGKNIVERKVLSKDVSNYEKLFYHTLSYEHNRTCKFPPFCTGVVEQPLRSLKAAIERSKIENHGFFRKKADFISIVISNEDERAADPSRATQATEVVQTFDKQFRGLKKQFVHFNIMVTDDQCKKKERKFRDGKKADIGRTLSYLADQTGGKNISICSPDYVSELTDISKHIKHSLESSYVLAETPIKNSIEVKLHNRNKSLDWSVRGRTIVFTGDIDNYEKVTVRYLPKY